VGAFAGPGFQFHCLWTGPGQYDDPKRERVLARMAAAGMRWARIDISWRSLETSNDSYNAGYRAALTNCVNRTVAHGLIPFIGVLGTPQWASGSSDGKVPPRNFDDFRDFMQWAASNYPSVAAWQIYNEPNGLGFWSGTIEQYVALMRAAYAGVKAGNPSAKVVTGGTVYNDFDWVASFYAAGGKGSFDAIGVHPYPGKADEPPEYAREASRYWFPSLSLVRNVMVQNGDSDKEIWITEFGYSDHTNASLPNLPDGTISSDYWWALGVNSTVQADFGVRAFKYAHANFPYVPVFIWYKELSWSLGSISPGWFDEHTQGYGLLRADESPRPVYCAMKLYFTGAGC
jgi:hypothetical protein